MPHDQKVRTVTTGSQPCDAQCPVRRAARIIDGKWTTLIVRDLLGGTRRFSELQRGLVSISPRLLTARLRLLEQEGVLRRTVYLTIPPTTEYALTPHGRSLRKVIEAMAVFGQATQRLDRRQASPLRPQRMPSRVHKLR